MDQHARHEIQQLIREVVMEAVPPTVSATLERFGFEVNDAKAMQRDMEHLRKLRRGSEALRSTAVRTCVGAVTLASIWVMVEGIKTWIKSGMNH